jgi:hypothetical protein
MALQDAGLGLAPIAASDSPAGLDWQGWVRHVASNTAAGPTVARELAVYLELVAMGIRNRTLRERLTAQVRAQINANAEAIEQSSPTPEYPTVRFAQAAYGAVLGLAILRPLSPDLVSPQAFEDVLLGLGNHFEPQT